MPHYESGSLRLRKYSERQFHLFSKLDALRQALRRWRLVLDTVQWIVFHPIAFFDSRRFPPRLFLLALAHAVNGVVRRDSIDPRPEIRSRRKLPQLLITAQERLLDHLFGIVPVPGHAVSQPENVVAVPLDENAIGIAIARERTLYSDGVALRDGLGAIDALLHPIH